MMQVALGQMRVTPGRREDNFRRAGALATAAAEQGAHLLLLPELWITGHDLAHAQAHAQAFADSRPAAWTELARSTGLFMAGSVLALDSAGRPVNAALVVSPQGEPVATYHKVHLFAPMEEKRYLTAGEAAPCFDLPWGRTALAICYDLRFPELFRRFARQGAALVLLPAAWPQARLEHWRILLRARAIENQCFIVACNRAGRDPGGTTYAGHSAVIGPRGEVIVEGKGKPDLLLAQLDLEEVGRTRRQFPVLTDCASWE